MSEKIIRLLEIYTIIARKEYPSVKSLRGRFHVSERTLYRYLELINIVDAIEYDHEKEGYKFTHGDRIKKLVLSQGELITLFSAGQAVSALGASFKENFQTLINRMLLVSGKALPEETGIIIKTPAPVFTDKMDTILKTISLSINEKRSVEITYKSKQSKTTGARIVDPYGLVYYEGIWIMIGFCHKRKDIRSFAVDRVLDIKERYLYFEPRKDFDLNTYLSHTWGIIDGKEVKIKVKFNTNVADYILRKEKWHSSEKRNILPNGDVELSFIVAGTDEIKRWIYSWLPNVEVVKPEWFRKQIQKELSESARNHS
ncbi:MAG: WYL domain-containing protein [Proteobacteria bacterium]|nr:WYL domain-containing protein [Pseudomonadota bacterium]